MSLKALTWAFERDCASPAQKVVLVALGDHANDAGIAWVGRATLVKKCSMSRSAVTRNLDALEEAKLIRRSRRERANRSYTSSLIVLAPLGENRLPMIDATEDDLPSGVDQDVIDALLKLARGVGAEKAHLGAESAQGGSGGGPQEPSEEPSRTLIGDEGLRLLEVPAVDPVKQIFDYWQEIVPGKTRMTLTDTRRKLIKTALKKNSTEQLLLAIDGVLRHSFLMGQNDRNEPYNDVRHIFKNQDRIEELITLADAAPKRDSNGRGKPSMADIIAGRAERNAEDTDWEFVS